MAGTTYDIATEIHRCANGQLQLGDHQISDQEWELIRDAVENGYITQTTHQMDFDIHQFCLTETGRRAFNLPATSHRSSYTSIAQWMQRLFGKPAR